MRIWLVEILVRLGVAVIADGRCRPRWYGSDQSRVVSSQKFWWCHGHFTGILRRKVTPANYYAMRTKATGGNWQRKQYYQGALECMWPGLTDSEREMLNSLNHANFYAYRNHPLVRRVLA